MICIKILGNKPMYTEQAGFLAIGARDLRNPNELEERGSEEGEDKQRYQPPKPNGRHFVGVKG